MKTLVFSTCVLVVAIGSIQFEHAYITDTWELVTFTPRQLLGRSMVTFVILWCFGHMLFD